MKKVSILSLFFLIFACRGSFQGRINEESTREVLDHHWEAFVNNDLNAVMEDYTEESILILPDKTHKGLDEIREVFIGAFESYPREKTSTYAGVTSLEE